MAQCKQSSITCLTRHRWLPHKYSQKHMTLKRVTFNSFPWNKAGDFKSPILCPNMDNCAGKWTRYVTSKYKEMFKLKKPRGCRNGAVVRALASHQCGPGSIPRLGVICGLSLLVLYSAPRGFLRVLRFPLSSKTNIWLVVLIVNFTLQCPQLVLQR